MTVGAGRLHPHMPPRIDQERRATDTISPARKIVVDFLLARLAANNARIAFLLEPTHENLTAWCDAEEALGNETE